MNRVRGPGRGGRFLLRGREASVYSFLDGVVLVRGSDRLLRYINDRNLPYAKSMFPNMKLITIPAGHWGESCVLLIIHV